ncbi:MAG: FAD:protein FMN transferase [Micrococcales bacterium]|nr:FAD:protein FMN transferase [Micrococcales bacterium]
MSVTAGARWAFEAIGVPWSVETPDPLPEPVRTAVSERIERFDRAWSRFRDDSLVSRMAREPGTWSLPPEAVPLLGVYERLHAVTGGRISPLVGDRLAALGYDGSYRLGPASAPAPVVAWADALAWDGERLTMLRPATLDVGAAGKGLLVDLVGEVLAAHGLPDSVIDASGDLRIRGRGTGRPERVALEHPDDPARAVAAVTLRSGALCGSAGNRRAWAGVHHILDAVTGEPTRAVAATWAIADSALVADGAATALFFVEGAAIAAALGERIEWVRLWADGRLERSAGIEGELFA